jgi:hypothetical protein
MTKPSNVWGRKLGHGDADRLVAATGLADGQYANPNEAADAHCKEKDQAKRQQWKDTRGQTTNAPDRAGSSKCATTTKAPWATKVVIGG